MRFLSLLLCTCSSLYARAICSHVYMHTCTIYPLALLTAYYGDCDAYTWLLSCTFFVVYLSLPRRRSGCRERPDHSRNYLSELLGGEKEGFVVSFCIWFVLYVYGRVYSRCFRLKVSLSFAVGWVFQMTWSTMLLGKSCIVLRGLQSWLYVVEMVLLAKQCNE